MTKKNYLFLIVALFISNSLLSQSVQQIAIDTNDVDLDSLAHFIVSLDTTDTNLSIGGRGYKNILVVENYAIITSNWIRNNTDQEPRTNLVVKLEGHPTAHSDSTLRIAYLIFFPDNEELGRPLYRKDLGRIDLSFHYSSLNGVMETLTGHPFIYCWYGEYPSGHIYGDIHGGRFLK